jgi:hypothetical protein
MSPQQYFSRFRPIFFWHKGGNLEKVSFNVFFWNKMDGGIYQDSAYPIGLWSQVKTNEQEDLNMMKSVTRLLTICSN